MVLEHRVLTVGQQKYFSTLILLITSFEIHSLSSPFLTHKNLPLLVIQGYVEVETKQSHSLAALYKPLSARNCLTLQGIEVVVGNIQEGYMFKQFLLKLEYYRT